MTRSTDGTEDDLPTYIRKAFGHDRSWMREGLCHPLNRDPRLPHMTWMVPWGEVRIVDGVRYEGAEMESLALPICAQCPQQWLCARWAIEVDERTGTWGIPFKLLQWLKRQPDNLTIVDNARVHQVTVQRAVQLVRDVRG